MQLSIRKGLSRIRESGLTSDPHNHALSPNCFPQGFEEFAARFLSSLKGIGSSQKTVFPRPETVIREKMHLPDSLICGPAGNGFHFTGRVVEPRNDGGPDNNGLACSGEPLQVVQDDRKVDAGEPSVFFRIRVFEVVKEEIGIFEESFQIRPGGVPRRLHGRVNPLVLACRQKGPCETALMERFPSAQGHPTSGPHVERLVPEDLSQCCLHRHPSALHDSSFSIADVGTGPAASARDAVKMNSPFYNAARTVRTDPCALEATDALIGMKKKLRPKVLGFGIAAPGTVERTAL